MTGNSALLIVDVQNDFCPGGTLAISDGDRVIGPANQAARHFAAASLPVLASRDLHPPDTAHFQEHGGLWPAHCVQGTHGACFHPELRLPEGTVVLSKGSDPLLPGYSAFEGTDENGRLLGQLLRELQVNRLYICGLATDYCVLKTTLDALKHGLQVTVLTDAVQGVELVAGASAGALSEMVQAGASLATTAELLAAQQ